MVMLSAASVIPAQLATGEDSRPSSFDSQGVPIQYTVDGKGGPVVLIHGLCANARINWRTPREQSYGLSTILPASAPVF